MSREPKYVITAVNELTGEREAISRPHSRWKTEELLAKARCPSPPLKTGRP